MKLTSFLLVLFISLMFVMNLSAQDLVAHWPMNEEDGTGTVVNDVVSCNNGTVVGLPD